PSASLDWSSAFHPIPWHVERKVLFRSLGVARPEPRRSAPKLPWIPFGFARLPTASGEAVPEAANRREVFPARSCHPTGRLTWRAGYWFLPPGSRRNKVIPRKMLPNKGRGTHSELCVDTSNWGRYSLLLCLSCSAVVCSCWIDALAWREPVKKSRTAE